MTDPVRNTPSLYDQLVGLPEYLVGEIVNGRLRSQPRPTGPHAIVESSLGSELVGPYQMGKGGPGGWWIIIEPELHFVRDKEVTVPDIAGWRKDRMPKVPRGHRFEIVPDWICEILSPSTAKFDRTEKMPLYAQYEVRYLWLIDPLAKTLEVFELVDSRWAMIGVFKDEDTVCVLPFQEITISLSDLWVETD